MTFRHYKSRKSQPVIVTQVTQYVPNAVVSHQSAAAIEAQVTTNAMSEVLVLYTGGTIGMKWTPKGYCPVPNYFENLLTRLPQFHDQDSGQPGLTTPVSIYGKRVHYRILELDPLLDSSNMSMKDWARIALAVQENYKLYDAFIILHGTGHHGLHCICLVLHAREPRQDRHSYGIPGAFE